jgi:tetratricopeptide (TPR) repeat protein
MSFDEPHIEPRVEELEDDEVVEVPEQQAALEVEKDISLALEAKEDGNAFFRDKDYDGAITLYSQAIAYCPCDDENKENMAVFLGNRAAAYFSIEEWSLVVDDCTTALENNANYVKVLHRRLQAYEKLDRVEEALADAKRIQELDPSWPKISATVDRLEKEQAEKMEKLKAETLSKLKDIGNSILGNFGMSLDNFKFKQDPNTGSWTVGMEK